jgi:epsilon-lactone hydrolase
VSREQLDKLLVILERQKAEDDRASIDEARALMSERCAKLLLPPDVRREGVSAAGVAGEVFLAPGADPERTILYLHGGGYVLGSTTTHAYLMQNVARAAGAAVMGIDYRLAPEHPFPAAVEDALAAYRWLLDRGRPPARIGVAGDSAGGGLTMALLVAIRDAGLPLPAAAACLSPWTDLAANGESIRSRAARDPMVGPGRLARMALAYLAGQDARHPLASPLYADLAGLPPLLVLVGGREILYDDAIGLAERASRAGVEVTLVDEADLFHVWPAFAPLLDQGQRAVDDLGLFFRRWMECPDPEEG